HRGGASGAGGAARPPHRQPERSLRSLSGVGRPDRRLARAGHAGDVRLGRRRPPRRPPRRPAGRRALEAGPPRPPGRRRDPRADAIGVRTRAAWARGRAAEGGLRLVPGALAGTATLEVRDVNVTDLCVAIGADGLVGARPGPVDASVQAETDGHGTGRATITA